MRRAAALPMVLFAMTLASALAVGGTYVTRQLAADAHAAQRAAEVEPAAERALVAAVASWDAPARAAQPIGTVVGLPPIASTAIATDAWVTRLDESLYWLVAESRGGVKPPFRRRIGLLVRVTAGIPALVPQRAWSELP